MRKKLLIVCLTVIFLGLVFVAGAFFGFEVYRSNHTLEVANYTVADERITEPVRMVVIADLHNREFGEKNEALIDLIRQQSPDIICCPGDFVIDKDKNIEVSKELIKELVEIAPVYFSMGNHEVHNQMNFPVDFQAIFESCGANVLEYEYEDVCINGQELRIGGIYGYCVPENDQDNKRYNFKHTDFLKEFMDTEQFTLLLTHMPYAWLELNGLEESDIDLIFSGHTHGGQIRIPQLGRVYAPLHGLFPGRVEGVYTSADESRTLILTRGLGDATIIPRINNVPEVMVVDLTGLVKQN
jgi:predicted MPP superfamily phosphohydrolase